MNQANTQLKFAVCFDKEEFSLNTENYLESYYIEKNIDVEAFKKIMYKFDMEEYTMILLYYFTVMSNFKNINVLDNNSFVFNDNREAEQQLEIDLTKALLFLYSDKSIDNTSITINKSRSSITIQNNTVVKHLANEIFLKYRSKGYNRINRTYEEAKKLMLADENWSKKVYHEVNIGTEINPIIVQQENEEEISMFAHSFTKEVTLNKDNLKVRLKYITTKYHKKRGAKVKNSCLASLIENLTFLKRIDKYINQPEIKHVCDMPLTNNDCRFVYACLTFFMIIEDNSINRSKTLPENYIRAILKQDKKDGWGAEYYYQEKLERILDLKNKIN
jgi:hypothetical protein